MTRVRRRRPFDLAAFDPRSVDPVGRPPPSLIAPENNCVKFFTHWVRRAPDRPAIVFPRKDGAAGLAYDVVTFGELDEDARTLAARLRGLGVRRGDRVLVMVPMSRTLYTILVALLTMGACAVFLDPWVPLEQIGAAAALVRPRAFLGIPRAHWLRLLARPVRRVPLKLVACAARPALQGLLGRHVEDLVASDAPPLAMASCGLDDTALITFTTGSTGTPKGSNRTQRFLNAQGVALDEHLPRRAGDVDMPALPIFVLNNLGAGVPSVLPLVDFMKISSVDPTIIVRQIRDWRVTSIGGSPSYLLPIARHCVERGVKLETIRGVVAGGAPVPPSLLRLLQWCCPNARGHIEVLYGSTEVEPVASIEADEVLTETAALTAQGRGNCVGVPVSSITVRLVRARRGPWQLGPGGWADLDVAPGSVGEVLVTGAHVQREYYRNPAAVAENKVADPDGRVWHRMGDLAWRDERGRLWLVGRISNAVELPGRTLYPIQVEGLATAVEGVERAALLELRGRAAVVVVPASNGLDAAGRAALAASVKAACAAAGQAVDEVLVRDAVPLDPRHNAKVEYGKLRDELLAAGSARPSADSPQGGQARSGGTR